MAMFMKTLYTPGVAHLSYIFGDDGKASVIDPRRDVDEYLDIAHRLGAKITHIFETHRNEDYVSGALELARRTGAEIYHGSQLDFHFGNPVNEGDEFHLGNIKLSILHTPGHTMESISIVYHDQAFSDGPLGVFTGDALFIGDVGRTDFYPDRAEEVAGMLYDSIFQKLLPLGDHVLLWPAHGAGSVCGSGIAERDFSTLGYERKHNPVLQKTDREEFVRFKIDEGHFVSPHFRQMEAYNLKGAPPLDYLPIPMPLSPDEFARAADDGMRVVDIRSPEAFAGTHLPKSFSLPLDALPAFAGMFLPYDQSLGLVVEDYSQIEEAVQGLTRIGYDKIDGFLAGGLHAWETSGRDYGRIEAIYIKDLEQRLEAGVSFTLLDVRSKEEFESGHLRTAVHVYLGDLPSKLKQIPKRRPITTICESGRRATIAAAFLGRQGMEPVEVCLGPMKACSQLECQVKTGDRRDASTEP